MKIALVLNDDFSMYHFRGMLISGLIERNISVTVIVPPGEYTKLLQSLGASVISLRMSRFISPLQDIILFVAIYLLFRREKFDIVHNMTIKPNIFGSIAARLAGVKRVVCLVSGAGFVFSEKTNVGGRIFRLLIVQAYRFAMKFADCVWFQNPDDMDEFVKEGLIPERKTLVIKSGGINLEEFNMSQICHGDLSALRSELGVPELAKCVVMVAARMVWSKGVREFVEVAGKLKKYFPDWFFVMLTPSEPESPDAVPQSYIDKQKESNLVIIDTFRDDVKNFIALADIVVLVSYYREGVPRTLLEAMALEKPIITATGPGCKEVVEDGINGYKITPRNTDLLFDKLKVMMSDPELRLRFGRQSRIIAKREFDSEIVVKRIVNELYLLEN
jgi:Glycosyltransferase